MEYSTEFIATNDLESVIDKSAEDGWRVLSVAAHEWVESQGAIGSHTTRVSRWLVIFERKMI